MKIDITSCEIDIKEESKDKVLIIPDSYWSDPSESTYTSTALSFYKELKSKIDVEFLSPPKNLIEQRSIEWFGPIIHLSMNIIQNHPDIIDLILDTVETCATKFTRKGEPPSIKLKVIVEERKGVKKTQLSYEGDVAGLDAIKHSLDGLFNGK
ncbi:hypothetical protein [Pantoea agglomerans]|uniref:hypothetical protein n=1 Tax=Enterobacter agglomerans TaxID=549 RepID=UPI0016541FE9|nr:hypothetical protein [Pantoea agglomerans]WNK39179.1 hypothetical protein RM160_15410 [Pantoea agglomerans]